CHAVDVVRAQDGVQIAGLDLVLFLDPGQVPAGRVTADPHVGPCVDGGLVDDAVGDALLDPVRRAPPLREDLADVDGVFQIGGGIDGAARTKVPSPAIH